MVQYNVSFFIVVTEIGVYIKILQENKTCWKYKTYWKYKTCWKNVGNRKLRVETSNLSFAFTVVGD